MFPIACNSYESTLMMQYTANYHHPIVDRNRMSGIRGVVTSYLARNQCLYPINPYMPDAYPEELLEMLLDQAVALLRASAGSLGLYDLVSDRIVIKVARGDWSMLAGQRFDRTIGQAEQVMTSGQPYTWHCHDQNHHQIEWVDAASTVVCIPLFAQLLPFGVLWIGRQDEFTTHELDVLMNITGITTQAMTSLMSSQKNHVKQNGFSSEKVLDFWVSLLALRDSDTDTHSQQTTRMMMRLAQRMGLSPIEQEHARKGALLHDIGKLAIPDAILFKPGPLTPAEWQIIRQHPVYAYQMLSSIPCFRSILDIPYAHHERWDGAGYPRGLVGEAIPLSARMFAVVDVWDALRSDRPYRRAWPEVRVREYIQSQAGRHFDPRIVSVFLEMLAEDDQYISAWSQ